MLPLAAQTLVRLSFGSPALNLEARLLDELSI